MRCRPAISSHSLGRAWVHGMPKKLDKAAKHGFDIELFYEDLVYVAKDLPGGASPGNLLEAARVVLSLCDERGIAIVCLQPFMHYEGLRDRRRHAQRVEEMKVWIDMAMILDTQIIAIPSTFLSQQEASGDLDLIVEDMREVADLAAPHGIRLAYESLAWGTYTDTWEQCWKIVHLVDRGNFGICLDTFNIAARVYADPASVTRKTLDAETNTLASIQRMVSTLPASKIFFVQVVDAEYLDQPLIEGHPYYVAGQPARMSWSRNSRLFYGESHLGAYLPVKDILSAILVDIGFEGWISAELFNKSLADPDPSVPEQHAKRAAVAWSKIVDDFGLTSPSGEANVGIQEAERLRAQL